MQVLEELERTDDARFLSIYESLVQHGFGPLDGDVAKLLKFRPQAIRKLPLEQRAKKAKAILLSKHQSDMAYELFGTYLLKDHRELVTGFLDATGVEHKEGMIEDLDTNLPDEKKLAKTVEELDQKFEPRDVTMYLALCAQQWPSVKKLDELWRKRAGAPAAAS
jgi:hypothetical protein